MRAKLESAQLYDALKGSSAQGVTPTKAGPLRLVAFCAGKSFSAEAHTHNLIVSTTAPINPTEVIVC